MCQFQAQGLSDLLRARKLDDGSAQCVGVDKPERNSAAKMTVRCMGGRSPLSGQEAALTLELIRVRRNVGFVP